MLYVGLERSRSHYILAKHGEYFVEPRADGNWQVRLPHARRASAVEATQDKAIGQAKKYAPEGVVHVKQLNGKFRHIP